MTGPSSIWRRHYNTVRPHSALGHRPPAPEATIPMDQEPRNALTMKLHQSVGAGRIEFSKLEAERAYEIMYADIKKSQSLEY